MKLEYFSDVSEEGRLQKNVRELIAHELGHFKGKRVHITVERSSGKRSLKQNNLFHMYIGIMAKELGYEFDEMKEIVKYKFLKSERVIELTGEVVPFVRQTSKLTKLEFIDLIDGMIRFAASLDIILPDPQSYYDEIQWTE